MKQIMIWMILAVGLLVGACHQTTVGYLLTENASYDPDTMYIRKTLDPELDAVRIENKAPWVSLALQGYEGTQQILFSVESVTSNQGEEAAAIFKKDLTIRGGGVLLYPLENDAKPGVYKVSVRLTNPGILSRFARCHDDHRGVIDIIFLKIHNRSAIRVESSVLLPCSPRMASKVEAEVF